jgi:hypothetical protein
VIFAISRGLIQPFTPIGGTPLFVTGPATHRSPSGKCNREDVPAGDERPHNDEAMGYGGPHGDGEAGGAGLVGPGEMRLVAPTKLIGDA